MNLSQILNWNSWNQRTPTLMGVFGSLFDFSPGHDAGIQTGIERYLDFFYWPAAAGGLKQAVNQYRHRIALEAALQPFQNVLDRDEAVFLAIKLGEILQWAATDAAPFLRRVSAALALSPAEHFLARSVLGLEKDAGLDNGHFQKFSIGDKNSEYSFEAEKLDNVITVFNQDRLFYLSVLEPGAAVNSKSLPERFTIRFGHFDELSCGQFRLLYRHLRFLGHWSRAGRQKGLLYRIALGATPTIKPADSDAVDPVLELNPSHLRVISNGGAARLSWNANLPVSPQGQFVAVNEVVELLLTSAWASSSRSAMPASTPAVLLELDRVGCKFGERIGLSDVSFVATGGQLVAVMGPSGCGKSTLLGTMTGSVVLTSGKIKLNGEDLCQRISVDPRCIGFVPQEDILFDTLSTEENLRFGARLRIQHASNERIAGRVQAVLEEVDLAAWADVRVGGRKRRNLSGGQCKRLNLGLELLWPKPVLLLDEPTSGLSSADSERILNILRNQADNGALVIAVIHQPHARLFRLFDRVLLLDRGGIVAFWGDPEDAVKYMAHTAPSTSSADGNEADPAVLLTALEAPMQKLDGRRGEQRRFEPKNWKDLFQRLQKSKLTPRLGDEAVPAPEKTDPHSMSLRQDFTLLHRTLCSKTRDWRSFALLFMASGMLGLLIGIILRSREFATGGLLQTWPAYTLATNGLLTAFPFLSTIVVLFLGMTASVTEVIKEREILKRERLLRLNFTVWLLSKFAVITALLIPPIAIYVLITFTLLQIPELHLWLGLYLLLIASVGVAIGLVISSVPDIPQAGANTVLPIVLVPQIVLCGSASFAFEDLQHLTVFGGSAKEVPLIADLMPARWGYEGLLALYANHSRWHIVDEIEVLDSVLGEIRREGAAPKVLNDTVNALKSLQLELNQSLGRIQDDALEKDIAILLELTAAGDAPGNSAESGVSANDIDELEPLEKQVKQRLAQYDNKLSPLVVNNPSGARPIDDSHKDDLLFRYRLIPFSKLRIGTEWYNGFILGGFIAILLGTARLLLFYATRQSKR